MADDSWVRTRIDRYLYEATRLNEKSQTSPTTAADYVTAMASLVPAVREQLRVFTRLQEELRRAKFPWQLLGFVADDTKLRASVAEALGSAEVWAAAGSPEGWALLAFKPVSQAFCDLSDCCIIMRKELGWPQPHSGGGPPGPPVSVG